MLGVGGAWGQGRGAGGRYLDGADQHIRRAGQGSQQGRGGGANVGAQEEGVRPLQADHPDPWGSRGSSRALKPPPLGQVPPGALTHERHDGCGEDAAALQHEGQAGAREDGQVAAEPAQGEWEVCGGGAGQPQPGLLAPTLPASSGPTGVDDGPHGLGDAAPQSGVEQLDDEDEAGAEHEQGGGQQDEAHGQVRERCALEQVAAWRQGRGG